MAKPLRTGARTHKDASMQLLVAGGPTDPWRYGDTPTVVRFELSATFALDSRVGVLSPTERSAEGSDQAVQAPDADGPPPVIRQPPRVWGANRFIRELDNHRNALVEGWVLQSAHLDFRERPEAGPGRPSGQCGVSSVWLLRKLGWLGRRRAWYCSGAVRFGDARPDVVHCWIEIGPAESSKRVVIDVTCDQFEQPGAEPVLCGPFDDLVSQAIEYKADSRTRFKALDGKDEIWDRLKILEASIADAVASGGRATSFVARQAQSARGLFRTRSRVSST